MTLRVQIPPGRREERCYILGVLLKDFLGLNINLQEGAGPDTLLSMDGSGAQLLLKDGLFAVRDKDWLTSASLPRNKVPLCSPAVLPFHVPLLTDPVPILYGKPGPNGAWVEQQVRKLILHADLSGGAFFLLTRYEEKVVPERDRHDRFPASASVAARLKILHRPLVNEYLEILRGALEACWPGLLPPRPAYRFRLSHDVDVPFMTRGHTRSRLLLETAGDLIKRRDLPCAGRRLQALMRGPNGPAHQDPGWTFPFMLRAEARLELRSDWHFMAEASDTRYDMGYRLDDPPLQDLMRELRKAGHHICFHPSYHTCDDEDRFHREWGLLCRAVEQAVGEAPEPVVRQHFLRWHNPATWRLADRLGLRRDSTLGFADALGFRCGTCYPYRVFDLEQRASLHLIEEPLTVMDTTLFKYLALSPGEALSTANDLVSTCRRFGGVFSLLWHNHLLVKPRLRETFSTMIEAAAS